MIVVLVIDSQRPDAFDVFQIDRGVFVNADARSNQSQRRVFAVARTCDQLNLQSETSVSRVDLLLVDLDVPNPRHTCRQSVPNSCTIREFPDDCRFEVRGVTERTNDDFEGISSTRTSYSNQLAVTESRTNESNAVIQISDEVADRGFAEIIQLNNEVTLTFSSRKAESLLSYR